MQEPEKVSESYLPNSTNKINALQHRPTSADLGIRSAGPLRTRNR